MLEDKKTDMPVSRCIDEAHSQHLCYLTDQYFHIKCAEQFRSLVKDAEFKCKFCGRTAKKRRSMYYPDEL